MQCPRCFDTNVKSVGSTHYVCGNKTCVDDKGNRTQFTVEKDDKVHFPYNQIFVDKNVDKFYNKPYLKLKNVGNKDL